ncbi:MAG TPA: ABC transporter, partial [Actinomycetes bacterium]|nr:ABC transporter [Actinomycetes bacterium]
STGWPLTRWVHRVRRDPLRRLGLPSAERARPSRTALPAPTPAARAQVDVALREVAEVAAAELPAPWRRSTRQVALAHRDELVTSIGTVVARTDLGVSRRPWWVRLLSALQWALALATVIGVVWLVAALVTDWLGLPELPTYPSGGLPLPTLLVLVGAAGGLALALVGSALARSAGRRAARRVARRLRDAISRVAGQLVVEPVAAEASTHSRLADAVARVGGR